MFGAFKKIFSKSTSSQSVPPPLPDSAESDLDPSVVQALPGVAAAVLKPRSVPSGDHLELPFSAILRQVPKELYGKIAPAGVAGFNFCISKSQVLDQLRQGAVKVPFGELRKAAPPGAFVIVNTQDAKLIDLPLSEILSQLQPEVFARRGDQHRVQVPAEIQDYALPYMEPQLFGVDFVDPDHGFAVGEMGRIWSTDNAGKTWSEQQGALVSQWKRLPAANEDVRFRDFVLPTMFGVSFRNQKEGAACGLEGSVIVDKVRSAKRGEGLNVDTGEIVPMVKNGIIDPTMVTRSALQNAASIAKNILTTEAIVAEAPEKAGAGMGGGMPDMGGMM
jgi:hypothetical protein